MLVFVYIVLCIYYQTCVCVCVFDTIPCHRDAPASAKSKNIFKFEDCREVEMTSRVCRQWVDEETLDDSGVALAERIVRAGVQQLPRSPYMAIWWSSFLIDVQGVCVCVCVCVLM